MNYDHKFPNPSCLSSCTTLYRSSHWNQSNRQQPIYTGIPLPLGWNTNFLTWHNLSSPALFIQQIIINCQLLARHCSRPYALLFCHIVYFSCPELHLILWKFFMCSGCIYLKFSALFVQHKNLLRPYKSWPKYASLTLKLDEVPLWYLSGNNCSSVQMCSILWCLNLCKICLFWSMVGWFVFSVQVAMMVPYTQRGLIWILILKM